MKSVHNNIKIFQFSIICTFFLNVNLWAESYSDSIYKENIHTVQIHREGWKLSYPIITLNEELALLLSFDDISDEVKNYHYKIIHCNSDWKESELTEYEYIEGYLQNQIDNYSFSFNTYVDYVHYSLNLPNDDVKFKISGNYIIEVYEDFDETNVIFTKRFIIAEKLTNIMAEVKRPIMYEYRDIGHEIKFSIDLGSFDVNDPYNDIKTIILQNGRWDNCIKDLKPLFNRDGVLEYDHQSENVFNAGNEFRWFDLKSTRYQSPYIKSITFKDEQYYATLFPEVNKSRQQYFYNEDLNGKYYIEIQEENNDDTDADYIYVRFEFPFDEPVFQGDLYITGALTNWEYSDMYKMKYDPSSKSYKITLLLKQGYYNYQYVVRNSETGEISMEYTEGNHYETENDYIILVYYYGPSSRYERIIGYQITNSVHKDN